MIFYFVCTGNTCRSPIAETLFNEKYNDIKEMFHAESFGLFPDSSVANKNSVKVMEELGHNLLGFTPSSIEDKKPELYDLILTMTVDQRNYLRAMDYKNVYTLKEFAGEESFNIEDPYGQNIEIYRNVRNEIDSLMETLYYRLVEWDQS